MHVDKDKHNIFFSKFEPLNGCIYMQRLQIWDCSKSLDSVFQHSPFLMSKYYFHLKISRLKSSGEFGPALQGSVLAALQGGYPRPTGSMKAAGMTDSHGLMASW